MIELVFRLTVATYTISVRKVKFWAIFIFLSSFPCYCSLVIFIFFSICMPSYLPSLFGALISAVFANYFSNYGEIKDSVIMMDRHTGRPRGFGFVTFADPAVADKVLEEDHNIDGRVVRFQTQPYEGYFIHSSLSDVYRLGGLALHPVEVCFISFFYQVEVKKTVPREDVEVRGVSRTRKIFVGGIPSFLTEGNSVQVSFFFPPFSLNKYKGYKYYR